MTRSRFLGIWVAVIAVAILVAPGARADTIGTLQLTGAGGNPNGGGSNIADGVYLLPYYGSINGAKTPVPLVCDDYSHEVTLGESWSFVENTLATLSNTRWGTADQLQYEEAFWLISQVPSHSSDIAGIQFAIWKLFDKSTPDISDEDYWLSAANTAELNGFGGMSFSDYVILTPVYPTGSGSLTGLVDQRAGSAQEYILVTPEPSAILMFGTGILGVLGIARRKLRI